MTNRSHTFTHAIARLPGTTIEDGLRASIRAHRIFHGSGRTTGTMSTRYGRLGRSSSCCHLSSNSPTRSSSRTRSGACSTTDRQHDGVMQVLPPFLRSHSRQLESGSCISLTLCATFSGISRDIPRRPGKCKV